jgi:hypothetical protein
VVNQRWRCSLDPCVHDSGFTWPEAAWMRSSPTADAALRASAISAIVVVFRNGTPFASGVVEAAPTHAPAKQSACNSVRMLVDPGPVSLCGLSSTPSSFWM